MANSNAPDISVVIPHYQDLANLELCLHLLEAQTLPRERWEVIVCDNMSPVGGEAVAAVLRGRGKLVVCTERGAGPTRNKGASEARGAALAFLDSDCRPASDWLQRALEALKEAPLIGGDMTVTVRDPERRTASEAFETVFAFDNARYIREMGFSVSANLIMRREVWQAVGGFKPAISEDVDWCHRAKDAGFRVVYAPQVKVAHPARADFAELKRKWQRLVRESYLLLREKPYGRLRWLLRAWLVALSPFYHMRKVLGSRKLSSLQDRAKALCVLFAIRWYRVIEAHRVLLRGV